MYVFFLLFVVGCAVCVFVLCVHCSVFVLFCRVLFPTMRHVPLQVNNEHNTHNKTQQQKHVCVCCCLLLFVLFVFFVCCVFIFLCLFCFASSCFQLCRMFLYRLISNITNITKHETKHRYVFVVGCCCLCCLFCCVVWSCVCVFCFAFFLCPTMPHVPLNG